MTSSDLRDAVVDAIWNAIADDPNDPWGRGYISRETGTIDTHDIDMGNVADRVIAELLPLGYLESQHVAGTYLVGRLRAWEAEHL